MSEPKKYYCTRKCPEIGNDFKCTFESVYAKDDEALCPVGNDVRKYIKLNPAWIWLHNEDFIENRKCTGRGYAHCNYELTLKDTEDVKKLTSQDIIMLADYGNGCFGGQIHSIGDRKYFVKVYTD